MGAVAPSSMRGRSKRPGSRRVTAVSVLGIAACMMCYFAACLNNSYETSSLLNLVTADAGTIHSSSSTSEVQTRRRSETYRPVSCSRVLQPYQSGNSTDPNGGKHYVRHTVTDPRFWVSFHDAAYDPTRFSSFQVGYYYEKMLSHAFQEVLSTPPANGTKHRVIDVGGNIGWFSLLSAASGAEVSTFEPNPNNYLRTCESMRLNGWLPCSSATGGCLNPGEPNSEELNSNIHIYPYGVSDTEGELHFEVNGHNPGASKMISYETNRTLVVRVVSFDYLAKELGWLEDDIAILKIDVEGEEVGVFRGAKELLHSRKVQNLFMEGTGKNRALKRRLKGIMALLLESGYFVKKCGGYRGPSSPMAPVPECTNIVDHYMLNCLGEGRKKMSQCNLWWKLKSPEEQDSVSRSRR